MNILEQRFGYDGQHLGFGLASMTPLWVPNILGTPLVTDDEKYPGKLQKSVIKIKSIA